MTHIHHVTLQTGHARRSGREEVTAETVAYLAKVVAELRAGAESVALSPLDGRYRLQDWHAPGRCAQVTVASVYGMPLVTVGIALSARCGGALWRHLHEGRADCETDAETPPPAPWCAARLEGGIRQDTSAAAWLGDLERCLAWTWWEMREGRQ